MHDAVPHIEQNLQISRAKTYLYPRVRSSCAVATILQRGDNRLFWPTDRAWRHTRRCQTVYGIPTHQARPYADHSHSSKRLIFALRTHPSNHPQKLSSPRGGGEKQLRFGPGHLCQIYAILGQNGHLAVTIWVLQGNSVIFPLTGEDHAESHPTARGHLDRRHHVAVDKVVAVTTNNDRSRGGRVKKMRPQTKTTISKPKDQPP